MTKFEVIPNPYVESWLAAFFSARAAQSGGVIRRSRREVETRVGVARLELEVRRRGFHLLLCGSQYIVVCDNDPIRTIC
jgi:hypothetical protein